MLWHKVTLAVALTTLAGLAGAGPNAEAELAAKKAHFEKVKAFSLKALDERIRILEIERKCVEGANVSAALRQCHDGAHGERETLKQVMRPQLETLKQGPHR